MVGAGWLPRHAAEAELMAAAYGVGLPEREVRRTIRSGLDGGQQNPRNPPVGGWSKAEGPGDVRREQPAKPVPEADSEPVTFTELPWPEPLAKPAFHGVAGEL